MKAKNGSATPAGAIVGIVVGVILCLVITVLGFIQYQRYKQMKENQEGMIILKNVNINNLNLDPPSEDQEDVSFLDKVVSLKHKLAKFFVLSENSQKIGVDMQFDANRIRETTPGDYSTNGSRVNLKPTVEHDTDEEERYDTNRNGKQV